MSGRSNDGCQAQQILAEPVEFAAADHNLVLTKKGEVLGWGRANSGQLGGCGQGEERMGPKEIELPTESPVVFLFCGAHCSAVGTMDGSLFVLGQQLLHQLLNLLKFIQP
jgi:alpha-tubulin suppressor-like RCC1 family protein